MIEKIQDLETFIFDDLNAVQDSDALEQFRLKHMVKKGTLGQLSQEFRDVPNELKRDAGKTLNIFKNKLTELFEETKARLEGTNTEELVDVSLPGRAGYEGSYHPLTLIMDEIVSIFDSMGFAVAAGPEIEEDYYNFEMLNFPDDHPARDMQDTFFVKNAERKTVLRTHTSPVQIRVLKHSTPPVRCIVPGRVYRNEALDATHLAEFHQVEGLYVDKGVTFADLKATLISFFEQLYVGQKIETRFRPSFFPFTEPSAEMDLRIAGKQDSKWMELCGCGMVHPQVLRNCGIDPEEYSGFAIGFGVERMAMIKYGLQDIRDLYDNNLSFLRQFV